MTLAKIALMNLKIRKSKMGFVLVVCLIGVGTVVALLSLSLALQNKMDEQVRNEGFKFRIEPYSQEFSFSYQGIAIADLTTYQSNYLDEKILDKLRNLEQELNITAIAPKQVQKVTLNSREILLVGVDPEAELAVKPWWRIEGQFSTDKRELLLGHELAVSFNVRKNDVVILNGRQWKVGAILQETGQIEDTLAFLPLSAIQESDGTRVSFVEIRLAGQENLEEPGTAVLEIAERLRNSLPEVVVKQLDSKGLERSVILKQFKKASRLVSVVMLGMMLLIIAVTMLSSVKDRTSEIAVFRAIGYRQTHIMKIIFFEAAILTSFAGGAGYLAGLIVAKIIGARLMDVMVSGSLWWGLFSTIAMVLLGMTASYYPAKQAANLDPSLALRVL